MDHLNNMRQALAYVRSEVFKEMTATNVELFLWIGMNEGITQHQLGIDFDMKHGTVSRNIKKLSRFYEEENGKNRLKGHDLVETSRDLFYRRRMACFLTKHGKTVFAELKKILKGE